MQTPYTVQQHRWVSGGTDSHGNPVAGHSGPVDVKVYGWATPSGGPDSESGADRVVVDVKLYAPASTVVGHRDLFEIPSGPNAGTFEVEGEVEDYNHGPFGFVPGIVVNLQRVDG